MGARACPRPPAHPTPLSSPSPNPPHVHAGPQNRWVGSWQGPEKQAVSGRDFSDVFREFSLFEDQGFPMHGTGACGGCAGRHGWGEGRGYGGGHGREGGGHGRGEGGMGGVRTVRGEGQVVVVGRGEGTVRAGSPTCTPLAVPQSPPPPATQPLSCCHPSACPPPHRHVGRCCAGLEPEQPLHCKHGMRVGQPCVSVVHEGAGGWPGPAGWVCHWEGCRGRPELPRGLAEEGQAPIARAGPGHGGQRRLPCKGLEEGNGTGCPTGRGRLARARAQTPLQLQLPASTTPPSSGLPRAGG